MQQRHRIFIAINLPSDIKKVLGRFSATWSDLPAKWVSEENLHITLAFLGDLTDLQLGEVCMATKQVAQKHQALDIMLNRVGYGPAGTMPPKMVWASGEKLKELSALKKDTEVLLCDKIPFTPERRAFAPHVTLARISAFGFKAINPEERPEIDQVIDMVFTVESIEVMESQLGRGGPRYTVIESHQLQ